MTESRDAAYDSAFWRLATIYLLDPNTFNQSWISIASMEGVTEARIEIVTDLDLIPHQPEFHKSQFHFSAIRTQIVDVSKVKWRLINGIPKPRKYIRRVFFYRRFLL